MIGQKTLLTTISHQIKQGTFSRFCIFVGDNGSEKNVLAQEVANLLDANCVKVLDTSVSTIREIIDESYRVRTLTVYNITDADGMSVQARNALLKVTEEPPNKAYFIMTLEDINNTLPTLKSRASVSYLDPYLPEELTCYVKDKYPGISDVELHVVLEICNTPGDVDMLCSYGVEKFYTFVEKVVDNVAEVSGANVFKIGQSIKFKETDETGYVLSMFWKTFILVCFNRKQYSGVLITSQYLAQLRIKSVNRSMLFDRWILQIRQEWQDGSK